MFKEVNTPTRVSDEALLDYTFFCSQKIKLKILVGNTSLFISNQYHRLQLVQDFVRLAIPLIEKSMPAAVV